MRSFSTLLFALLVSFGTPWQAAAEPQPADVVLNVKGMVCSFSVQGVEKKLLDVPAVRQVEVQLKAKSVHLWLKKGQTATDVELTAAIEAAGYNIASIIRRGGPPKTDGKKPKADAQ